MTEPQLRDDDPHVPVWARREAFPVAPDGWGWLGLKRKPHPCATEQELLKAIREDLDGSMLLVWSPAHRHMILPEELEHASEALMEARKRRASNAMLDSQDRMRWFGLLLGGVLAYMLYQGWSYAPVGASGGQRIGFALGAVLQSTSLGIAALMFLILAFIPWYQARKRLGEIAQWQAAQEAQAIPALRFETWLDLQRAPVTKALLALVAVVFLTQIIAAESAANLGIFKRIFIAATGGSLGDSIEKAGLVKPLLAQPGEWWRLLTAPLLHGNMLHFVMNAAALVYLGRRVEVFAGWPHVPGVFLISAYAGGLLSAKLSAATSVGASGGLMGWLGFLLVFESLHSRLVPQSARRRLLAGVVLTAVIGIIGFKFIDNAAHAGGLIVGMLYAAIVFPKSTSAARPRATTADLLVGTVALAILAASGVWAIQAIVG